MKKLLVSFMVLAAMMMSVAAMAQEPVADVTTDKELTASQAAVEVKEQTLCPISGNEINKEIFVDFEGKRIFLAAEEAKAKFLEDPAMYVTKMVAEGITLADVPAPVTEDVKEGVTDAVKEEAKEAIGEAKEEMKEEPKEEIQKGAAKSGC